MSQVMKLKGFDALENVAKQFKKEEKQVVVPSPVAVPTLKACEYDLYYAFTTPSVYQLIKKEGISNDR